MLSDRWQCSHMKFLSLVSARNVLHLSILHWNKLLSYFKGFSILESQVTCNMCHWPCQKVKAIGQSCRYTYPCEQISDPSNSLKCTDFRPVVCLRHGFKINYPKANKIDYIVSVGFTLKAGLQYVPILPQQSGSWRQSTDKRLHRSDAFPALLVYSVGSCL